MAYSCDAFTREQQGTRETLKIETSKKLARFYQEARDGAMANGLTQSNKIGRERDREIYKELERVRECQRELESNRERVRGWQKGDMVLFRCSDDRLTD